MTIIELPIDEAVVPIYESIPEEYRQKIGLMVSIWLKELHGSSPERLLALMRQIDENAQSRGLTPKFWMSYWIAKKGNYNDPTRTRSIR